MKYYSLCLIFLALNLTSFSQPKQMLKKCIKDKETNAFIAYASITNLSTHLTTLSHKNGCFDLIVRPNDLIAISAIGYYFDTIRVSEDFLKTEGANVDLRPLAKELQGVTVYGKSNLNKYQRDSILRRSEFLKDMGSKPLPTVSPSNSGAGIGINLDHFYGREKRKRNAIDIFNEMENEEFINYYFNATIVSKYAALLPDDLMAFLQKNRPTYKWLRKHNTEEDLLYYINEKLKQEAKTNK